MTIYRQEWYTRKRRHYLRAKLKVPNGKWVPAKILDPATELEVMPPCFLEAGKLYWVQTKDEVR